MIRTILFDFDGTLADTNQLITQSHLHVLNKYFPGKYCENSVKQFNGPSLAEVYGELLPDKAELAIQEYRTFNEEQHDLLIKSFPNVHSSLEILKSQGIEMAIVSTKLQKMVQRGLKSLDIKDFFSVVLGGDDYQNSKPDPEALFLAMSRLNAGVESTIMVGDNWHDIQAATNAGVRSVFVEWSEKSLDEIQPYQPNKTVASMQELVEWVKIENQKVRK